MVFTEFTRKNLNLCRQARKKRKMETKDKKDIYMVVSYYDNMRLTYSDLNAAKTKASELSARNHGPSHTVVKVELLGCDTDTDYPRIKNA